MKIGIICTAFNTDNYVKQSLEPWILARQKGVKVNETTHIFQIAAVSVPFEKFGEKPTDNTQAILKDYKDTLAIDFLLSNDIPMKETDARGKALEHLIAAHCDVVWQVDSDEFYTLDEISRIISFIESQPLIAAFRLCLKNFVFTESTHLCDPFTPMRIHRVIAGAAKATGFFDDNNVVYQNEGVQTRDVQLATMTVPFRIAWIKHLTWLSDDRSKKKVAYQTARGWQCSFKWNEEKNTLEFNTDYYTRHGLKTPQLFEEFRCK